ERFGRWPSKRRKVLDFLSRFPARVSHQPARFRLLSGNLVGSYSSSLSSSVKASGAGHLLKILAGLRSTCRRPENRVRNRLRATSAFRADRLRALPSLERRSACGARNSLIPVGSYLSSASSTAHVGRRRFGGLPGRSNSGRMLSNPFRSQTATPR